MEGNTEPGKENQAETSDSLTKKGSLPKWLGKLQNESWQAEMLISGSAFFGLLNADKAIEPFCDYLLYSTNLTQGLYAIIKLGSYNAALMLIFGFLIHLILRAFWIGLIGLNYVFPGGIDNDKLSFKGRFQNLFRESQNTPLIISIDKFCGAIFAITFVFLFSILGFLLYLGIFFALVAFAFGHDIVKMHWIWRRLFGICVLTILIAGVITFIDFMTVGRLKKIKWFARFYYPIHKIVSFVTLSFVYRRLYYTIISNVRWGYMVLIFSVPVILISMMMFLESIGTGLSKSFNDRAGFNYLQNDQFLSIRSETVYDNYLDVSLLHLIRLEDEVFIQWQKSNPTKSKSFEELDSKVKLGLINNLYRLYIDGNNLSDTTGWLITKTSNGNSFLDLEKIKLVRVLDISNLSEGSHQLAVKINLDSTNAMSAWRSGSKKDGYFARVNFYLHKPSGNSK